MAQVSGKSVCYRSVIKVALFHNGVNHRGSNSSLNNTGSKSYGPCFSHFDNVIGGLSTAAEAGIGIGAVVGAIRLETLGHFLWRRRQKGRSVEGITGAEQAGYRDVHELNSDFSEQEKSHVRQPADLRQPAELLSQIAHELLADVRTI
ncbi:MAG: hypothetical protein Q9223_002781 [Gallowayella weberi]